MKSKNLSKSKKDKLSVRTTLLDCDVFEPVTNDPAQLREDQPPAVKGQGLKQIFFIWDNPKKNVVSILWGNHLADARLVTTNRRALLGFLNRK